MWIMFIVIYIIVQNFGVRKFSFWKRKTFFIKQGCVKLIKSDLCYRTKFLFRLHFLFMKPWMKNKMHGFHKMY